MLRLHDLVLQRQDEVLDIIQLENGKARRHAFEEVVDVCLNARYDAHTADDYLSPSAVRACSWCSPRSGNIIRRRDWSASSRDGTIRSPSGSATRSRRSWPETPCWPNPMTKHRFRHCGRCGCSSAKQTAKQLQTQATSGPRRGDHVECGGQQCLPLLHRLRQASTAEPTTANSSRDLRSVDFGDAWHPAANMKTSLQRAWCKLFEQIDEQDSKVELQSDRR
jgi:hypothetical protein